MGKVIRVLIQTLTLMKNNKSELSVWKRTLDCSYEQCNVHNYTKFVNSVNRHFLSH
jgi:murein L,D-transpeptidase YafK